MEKRVNGARRSRERPDGGRRTAVEGVLGGERKYKRGSRFRCGSGKLRTTGDGRQAAEKQGDARKTVEQVDAYRRDRFARDR